MPVRNWLPEDADVSLFRGVVAGICGQLIRDNFSITPEKVVAVVESELNARSVADLFHLLSGADNDMVMTDHRPSPGMRIYQYAKPTEYLWDLARKLLGDAVFAELERRGTIRYNSTLGYLETLSDC